MSTTIITQYNGQNRASAQTSQTQDDVWIAVSNPITHGEGSDKFTDYEVKVQVSLFSVFEGFPNWKSIKKD